MEFRILGPLEVADGDRILDVGPRRQRAVLAFLVLQAGRVVSTERILQAIWGDESSGKERALWVYISRLRDALEPDRTSGNSNSVLLTVDHGYVLKADQIDATQFAEGVDDAMRLLETDPALTRSLIDARLELWRGEPLEDFTYDEFAQAEIHRLIELRTTALETQIEAGLKLGLSGELVAQLEALQDAHPFRESFVRQSMLALYRSGRAADALRTFARFRSVLGEEVGIEPSPDLFRLEEQILLHDERLRVARMQTVHSDRSTNPYRGLRAFSEADADVFFGRQRIVADVIRRLGSGQGLVALVGPSGSGKSSVVRAGVIPRLRKPTAEVASHRLIVEMVPGAHPFSELAVGLRRAAPMSAEVSAVTLERGPRAVLEAALATLPDPTSRLILVIDQFEEIFTLVEDDVRIRFLDSLLPLIDDPHGRIAVLLTMRSDFYERCLAHAEFGAQLDDSVVNVVPLLPNELEQAAETPAGIAGVTLERSLVVALVSDVVGQPGGLPLFQHVLTELFDRRSGPVLRLDDYRERGGVRGSLTRRADSLFEGLSPEVRPLARRVLLRLVSITSDGEVVRRRVQASEILALDADTVALHEVVDTFVQHRFLTTGRDSLADAPTVELSHETLLTSWGRLKGWIDEAHDDLRRRDTLNAARMEWLETGRDPGYLLQDSRLQAYERWAGDAQVDLTRDEAAYLEASTRARTERESIERRRDLGHARVARSASRRLWGLVAAIGGALMVGAIAVWVAFGPEPAQVAIVYWGRGTTAIQDLVASGIDRSVRELDVEVTEVTPPFSGFRAQMERVLDDGAELVLVVGAEMAWEVVGLPEQYPEVTWIVNDHQLPGVPSTLYENEEGAYLAGVAAATVSQTDIVGFVGALQIASIESFRAGFEAGAQSVSPDVEVLSTYLTADDDVSPWQSPELGQRAAAYLYERGADVVFHAAGESGLGVFEAAHDVSRATDRHRWAIGVDSDQYLDVRSSLRPHVLTSMVKRYDTWVFDTIRRYVSGAEPDLLTIDGLLEGAVGISDTGGHLSTEASQAVEEATADVISGLVQVPTVPSTPPLAPVGVSPDATVSLVFDRDGCAVDRSPALEPGQTLELHLDNRTPEAVRATVFEESDVGVSVEVPVAADGRSAGFVHVAAGESYEVRCGLDDVHPTDAPRVASFTVDDRFDG